MNRLYIVNCVFILLASYSYIIYPFLLFIISAFRTKSVKSGLITPSISFLICAHNEQDKIRNKIENTLSLNYPEHLLQIIIISDCSTDSTDSIISEYPAVTFMRSPVRVGKEHALKLSLKKAQGEIIVFSDVATILDNEALHLIVRNFYDPSIGAVSSIDKFLTTTGHIAGESVYVKYEMLLRRLESKINGLIGVSGSFFAARKVICQNWADDLASDFNTVLLAIKLGYRSIIDPEVVGYYSDLKSGQSEFPRKVRTVIAGITVFFRTLSLLNVFKYGLYSWQIFSHKLMRWLVPFFLVCSFSISFFGNIHGDLFSLIIFQLELIFIGAALIGYFKTKLQNFYFFKIPFYFLEVNSAILIAWFSYLSGRRITIWEPSKR